MTNNHETSWTAELLDAPHNVQDKRTRVQSMFNSIAGRYQLVNTVFSAGRDAAWRRKAVRLARVVPDDDVLDIACGTGDFARTFAAAGPRSVVGCDFAHEMLTRARGKLTLDEDLGVDGSKSSRSRELRWLEADAQRLPFRPASFSVTSCAFGVRNFEDLDMGLSEMFRVLVPGGRAVILEFTRPTNVAFRRMYELYANRLMPWGAGLITGDRSGAYRYLPRSVVSFCTAKEMCERLRRVGFAESTATTFTFGIVTAYVAKRA